MAGNLDVDHNGHLIRYSENEDVWRCYDIDYANAKLSSVKRKCDEVDRKARDRAGSIPGYYIGHNSAIPCKIIRLGKRSKRYNHRTQAYEDRLGVWIVYSDGGKNKRQLVDTESVAPDNDVVKRGVALADEARIASRRAADHFEEMHMAIPRFAADDLVKAFGGEVEEDNE